MDQTMCNDKALVKAGVAPLVLRDLDECQRFAQVAIAAGIGAGGDQRAAVAKAVIAIEYGAELKIPPMHSLAGVYIVQGKPALNYALIGSLIKGSGRYNYRIIEHTEHVAAISFSELVGDKWESCGESRFTIDDAKAAGLLGNATWKKYPKNMLFARSLTNGARWYCPDVFGGAVYLPEELDLVAVEATVIDGHGKLREAMGIDAQPEPAPEPVPDVEPQPADIEPAPAPEQPEPAETAKPAAMDEMFPATTAQVARLKDLAAFAHGIGLVKMADSIWDRADDKKISKGRAGVLIAQAKAALAPKGWVKKEDRQPESEPDEPPAAAEECVHPAFFDGACTECGTIMECPHNLVDPDSGVCAQCGERVSM